MRRENKRLGGRISEGERGERETRLRTIILRLKQVQLAPCFVKIYIKPQTCDERMHLSLKYQ